MVVSFRDGLSYLPTEFIKRMADPWWFFSRSDKFFTDDAVSFNSTIYDQSRAYWTDELIDIQMAANARLARMVDSVKYNPKFTLSELAADFSAGEGAGYMLVFGNKTEKKARRDLVEYFFGMCRIPMYGSRMLITKQRMSACPLSWAGRFPARRSALPIS